MISEAAVKRVAREQGVDPVVIDRDHALSVVLWALAPELPAAGWVFKGGTCLRKCYYGDYRFSEDLDFTVVGPLRKEEAESLISRSAATASSAGIRLLIDQLRTDVVDDEYGRKSLEIRVPYAGALRMGGSPPNIQLHLSAHEDIVFGIQECSLIHPYDDANRVAASLPCYSREEVLAEKLRAVAGQRRHAIARDIYDIAQLLRRGDVDSHAVLEALPRKAAIKSVELEGVLERFLAREAEYRANWDRTLAYLVPGEQDFNEAFRATADLLGRIRG